MARRWPVVASLVALAGAVVSGCSGSADLDAEGSGATATRVVAVVSDSEITPEIVDAMEARPDIDISYRHNAPGATIAELDGALDEALATQPAALVYTAGANDLLESGIDGMLESLRLRLDRAAAVTCVVYAVPAVDVSTMDEGSATLTRNILDGFSAVLDEWGTNQVPYLEIVEEMDARGERFFAEGSLGSFHPGEDAYPAIADALVGGLDSCP